MNKNRSVNSNYIDFILNFRFYKQVESCKEYM